MGAFHTKGNVCLSDLGTVTGEQNEIYKCKESIRNAVNQAIPICGPMPPECNEPHGLEVTVDSVRNGMDEEIENSSYDTNFQVIKHIDYSLDQTPTDYQCDKAANTPNADKLQHLSENEKLNSAKSMELTTSETFTGNYNSKVTVNFLEKLFKKECIDDNMSDEPGSTANKSPLAQNCEWVQNPFSVVEIKEQANFQCDDLKQEIDTENSEVTKCRRPLKWIRNPFSVIAEVTRSYGLLMTERQGNLTDLHTNNTEIKQESKECSTENFCLTEIKQEEAFVNKSCSESDHLSDFHSLHNTSFESLAQSETAVEPLYKINNETPYWMVQLPECPRKPLEMEIKPKAIDARLVKKKDKTVAKPRSKKPTPKQVRVSSKHKIKTKSNRRSKGSKRLPNYARNCQRALKKCAKKTKGKRWRTCAADKTYNCPVVVKSFAANKCCRVLRSKRNEYLNNKYNNKFPKPLVEQKPEIVLPPAPIQIKTAKGDLDINGNEITVQESMQLACDETNYSECKIERLTTDTSTMTHLTATKIEINEFTKLQEYKKIENNYESIVSAATQEILHNNWQPIVRLKEMKLNLNANAFNRANSIQLEHTTSLTTLIQCPRLGINSPNLRVDESKNFEILKTQDHAVLPIYTMPTQSHSKCLSVKLKKELTPECAAKSLYPIEIQKNNKLLQTMQPRVCLQRLPLLKTATQLQLVNTYKFKQECEPIKYNLSTLFKTLPHSIMNIQNNCKLLKSLQPKVRLKRLNFTAPLSSFKCKTKVRSKLNALGHSLNLQPVVRVQRLKFNDFKLHRNITYENVENHTQQLNVDLEVKRERECYDEKTAYELRKRNMHKVVCIKEEKISPKRSSHAPLTSTPKLRIARAFSMQPIVRLRRLKCMHMSTDFAQHHTFEEPETPIKMEVLDVAEEQLTPISFAKQYDEQDSGIYSDTTYRRSASFAYDASISGRSASSSDTPIDEFSKHEMLFEIALQRACINDILLRHGYSPVQFRLYNNLEDLKIFLDYLLVK